jgi:hypothetical protein
LNTNPTYSLSIQRRSRTSLRIKLPIDTEGIEQIVLNGIAFKLNSNISKSSNKRVILSARKREEIGEKIDTRFCALQKEQPELNNYEIYSIISNKSEAFFGIHLDPRQVEGKHRTYTQFIARRIRKNAPW